MIRPFLTVQPPFGYLEPAFSPVVFSAVKAGCGPYLRYALGIDRINVPEIDRIVSQFRDFMENRTRLIIAFRHIHVNDGPLLFHLFANLVPEAARKSGKPMPGRTHAHYVYARNVPLWSGSAAAWLFPKLGAVPVLKGGAESRSLSLLRRYLVESNYPIAIAPEAQVTYHNGYPGALDPGVSRLAFWCFEDLAKAGRKEDVRILPVMNHYAYRDRGFRKLDKLIGTMEKECGTASTNSEREQAAGAEKPGAMYYYERIMRLLDAVLDKMESYYARFHGYPFGNPLQTRQERIDRIVDAALHTGETFLGLPHTGTFLNRVLQLRTRGLSRIFRDDIPSSESLPPLEKHLADRLASESSLVLNHMELADVLEYLRDDYLKPDSEHERFMETALDIADIVSRLEGGNISCRPDPFKKDIEIRIGNPLSVSSFLTASGNNRREAIDHMVTGLEQAFLRLSGSHDDRVQRKESVSTDEF